MKLFIAIFCLFGTACWIYVAVDGFLPVWVCIIAGFFAAAASAINFYEYFKPK